MESATIKEWISKDLWSERELQELCCGLNPNEARQDTDELNQAAEAIKRAILSKKLPCICPSDATQADRLYGHARFFTPDDAIEWAAPKFPNLPFKSVGQDKQLPRQANMWPWGKHDTELLQKLAAAAKNFWTNYDPSDPSTAPTNQHVIDWLKQQNVAQRNAEIMATILRADGLPTGPRK